MLIGHLFVVVVLEPSRCAHSRCKESFGIPRTGLRSYTEDEGCRSRELIEA